MGCIFSIVKSVVALVLGLVVFFGFLFLLLTNNLSDKLLSADFYSDIIHGQDTYNRIYDEVLLDDELQGTTSELLGNIQVLSQEDIVRLLKEVMPPEYLRSQVDGSIQRTVDYFNEDLDTLDVSIDLAPPMENIRGVLFREIDRRIDGLDLEDLGAPECTADRVTDLARRYESRWMELAAGKVPTSIPSVESLTQSCRGLVFELAFARLVSASSLDQRAKTGLLEMEAEIKREFVERGDTREVLKLAARPLATPLMDDAVEQIKAQLDGDSRLDLVHRFAIWNDDITETELRSNIETARDWVNVGRKFGKPAAWAMLIAGSILLGLLHWPSLKNALRWPGVTLFLTGVVFFITGKVLESQVPDRLADLVELGANQVSGIPPSVTDLGGDLLISFGKELTGGIDGAALVLIIIGALLIGASLLISLLGPPLLLLRITTGITTLLLKPFVFLLGRLLSMLRRKGREPSAAVEHPEPASITEGPESSDNAGSSTLGSQPRQPGC